MTNTSITQSQKRTQESLSALFSNSRGEKHCLFLKSSSDTGVIRNGGRNGARFAPQSLIATFKKFSQSDSMKTISFSEVEVADGEAEKNDFASAQKLEAQRITEALQNEKESYLVHLGGGHDHVYPLLRAKAQEYSRIVIFNIDAHADTRTDSEFHSGTPFRQFANEYQGELHLIQLGLHPFANSFSTLSPLNKGSSSTVWKNDLIEKNISEVFQKASKLIDEKTFCLFSLDADALCGFEVPGVSAVNPNGISLETLKLLWKNYSELRFSHPWALGVYELNPVYDTLASISMRTIGSFIFECLENKR